MSVYLYRPEADEYKSLRVPGRLFDLFDKKQPLAPTWRPLRVEGFHEDIGRPMGDFPSSTSNMPILSARAWEVLKPLIGAEVEELPILVDSTVYYAIHVLDVVDCLDYVHSQVERFSNGRMMMVTKYAFIEERIKGKHMFQLPENYNSVTLVS